MKCNAVSITTGIVLAALMASTCGAVGIAIQNTRALSFGSFVAGSAGTVTVSTGDVRSASGGVMLIPSSMSTAAQYTVSGDPNATYTIQLPTNDYVKLTGPGVDMVLNAFTSSPSGAAGQLDAGGSQTLSVGATLSVGSGQIPGDYSGSFTVIVNYN
ncbi:DUF4402 domain-containing protein [Marinobacter sp.]|uniref:DUF4402 domain-containing protein n=1 Tax=Marinobacter sp. TaxID=50741 RepID=UPI003A8F4AF7